MRLPKATVTYDRFIELELVMYRKKVSQLDLAKLLGGDSTCMISNRLRGKSDWRLDEIYKVMAYLGLPLSKIYDYFPPEEEEVSKEEEASL